MNIPDRNIVRPESINSNQKAKLDAPTSPSEIDADLGAIPAIATERYVSSFSNLVLIILFIRKTNWRSVQRFPSWLKCLLVVIIGACIAAAVVVPVVLYAIQGSYFIYMYISSDHAKTD